MISIYKIRNHIYTIGGDFMKSVHPFKPIYDAESKVLILGSFPSIISRENSFYYANPRNRFWNTLERVFDSSVGNTIEDKILFLKKHHIALYDVVYSCDIVNSSDNSISNVIPTDLLPIINNSKIKYIFTTGNKAYELYNKYQYPITKIKAYKLSSPSPANCKKGIDDILYNSYMQIKDILSEN